MIFFRFFNKKSEKLTNNEDKILESGVIRKKMNKIWIFYYG